jgi:hypothetical protein
VLAKLECDECDREDRGHFGRIQSEVTDRPTYFPAPNTSQSPIDRCNGRSSVRLLCGPRAQVYLAPHSAKVVLSGEYLEDRNLDSIARNIALSGLNVFPNSEYFAVSIQDSQGSGYAEVRR